MATALIAVAAAPAAAPTVSEALIEQLLLARERIGRLRAAFQLDMQQRTERAQRDLADQAAQGLAAAPEPLNLRIADSLATLLTPVIESAERDQRLQQRLEQVARLIDMRLHGLKRSPAERELLIKVLKKQHERLCIELQQRRGQTEELNEALARIEHEIEELSCAEEAAAEVQPPPPKTTRARSRKG